MVLSITGSTMFLLRRYDGTMIYRKSFFLILVILCFFLSACGVDISGRPPFEKLTFSHGATRITAEDGRYWDVVFEYDRNTTFTGVVRHVSLWYDFAAPFMSHDILITTGDFSSRQHVAVVVMGHKFFYRSDTRSPKGSLNLLHILPASDEVFNELTKIGKWDEVRVVGREILRIDAYQPDGTFMGYMTDAGCNTILVTSAHVQAVGTPIP